MGEQAQTWLAIGHSSVTRSKPGQVSDRVTCECSATRSSASSNPLTLRRWRLLNLLNGD